MVGTLAVDGGQTGLRARVQIGPRTAQVQVPGFGYSTDAATDPVRTMAALVRAAWAALPGWARQSPGTAALGLTGELGRADAPARLAAEVAAITGAGRIRIAQDAVTAHLGALAGRPGVVLAAGTGTVALALDSSGRGHRVDGWGHLLGDGGSGFAIGRAGLRLVAAAADGRGPATVLTTPAQRRFGPIADLPARIYRSATSVADVAAFAAEVLAAARDGDEPANRICAGAVDDLVRTTVTAVSAVTADGPRTPGSGWPGPRLISYVGGVLTATDELCTAWIAKLAQVLPTWQVCPPAGTGLDGAALLARAAEPSGWARLLDHDGPAGPGTPLSGWNTPAHGNRA